MIVRVWLAIILACACFPTVAEDAEISAEEAEYLEWAREFWATLDPQTGTVTLTEASATLNVPDTFYFLSAEDSEKVLVDAWGNPPGQAVLGMLFPTQYTPFDEGSWAVTIEYTEDGYISDDDAADMDYPALLKQMQEDVRTSSDERVEMGFEPITLVGWAAPPRYDASAHKLHWAKELKFGSDSNNTLNYNIRVLGRKGVLVLNFIAAMDQQPTIEQNLNAVLAVADFNDGARYADFDPSVDKVAAYGIGALVAGKVLAKTGLLAAGLIFLKKFGIFIVVGLFAIIKGVFGRKKTEAATQ